MESVEFSGVDFDQAGSDAVAGESSGGDAAAQGAGGDIYAVGGFREGDQVLPREPRARSDHGGRRRSGRGAGHNDATHALERDSKSPTRRDSMRRRSALTTSIQSPRDTCPVRSNSHTIDSSPTPVSDWIGESCLRTVAFVRTALDR